MKSPDEMKKPFTCEITKKYVGADIQNIRLDLYKDESFLDPKNLFSIPISSHITEKISKKTLRKIRQLLLKEIKNSV